MHAHTPMRILTALLLLTVAGCQGTSTPSALDATAPDAPPAASQDAAIPSPDVSPDLAAPAPDLVPDRWGDLARECPVKKPEGPCAFDPALECPYMDGECQAFCSCRADGTSTCWYRCPRCPAAPPTPGSTCLEGNRCQWFVGCALLECTCARMRVDFKSPARWACQTGPGLPGNPQGCDGGLPSDR